MAIMASTPGGMVKKVWPILKENPEMIESITIKGNYPSVTASVEFIISAEMLEEIFGANKKEAHEDES